MLYHVGTTHMETQRLILRPFKLSDAGSAFHHWAGDEDVQNDYGEPVHPSLSETKTLLSRYISTCEKPDAYRWAMIHKESGECVGQVAFFIVDSKNEMCELEYCIGKAYQNQGLTTEAVKAVVDYGFLRVRFNRIQVSHRNVNIASQRVIEKSGFVYEGTLRQYFCHNGEFQDRLYYSILREEWLSVSLVFPALEHKQAAWEYRQEHIDCDEHWIHGSGSFIKAEDYESWLDKITCVQTAAETGWVNCSTYFAFVEERIVGTIQIRHMLNDELLKSGGHIGYGVRPSERRKGYASRMLSLALGKCRELGMERVLVTCDKDNVGSARTIQKNGGVLENEFVNDEGIVEQRYWIEIQP